MLSLFFYWPSHLIVGYIPAHAPWNWMGINCSLDSWRRNVPNHDVFPNVWTLFIKFHPRVHIIGQVCMKFCDLSIIFWETFDVYTFNNKLTQKLMVEWTFKLVIYFSESFHPCSEHILVTSIILIKHYLPDALNVRTLFLNKPSDYFLVQQTTKENFEAF